MLRHSNTLISSIFKSKQGKQRRPAQRRIIESLEARQLLAVVAIDDTTTLETNPPVAPAPLSIDVTANDNQVPWEAGNIDVIQNNTGNDAGAGGAVELSSPNSTPGFVVDRDFSFGGNRGDYVIRIGEEAPGDFDEGLLFSSIAQTLVDHGQGQDTQSGISASNIVGDKSYYIAVFESSGSEYNANINAVHLPWDYPGIVLGATTNEPDFGEGGNNNGPLITIKSNSFPPMQIGSSFADSATTFIDSPNSSGEYDLRIPNPEGGFYDSNSDGILLATGLKNDDNYPIASPNADGTWTVLFQDVTTPARENDGIGFAFVPNNSPLVTAGRVAGDATVLANTAGSFTTTDLGNGQIRLEVAGGSPTQGSLITTPDGAVGSAMDDNIVNFEPDGDGWIISSLTATEDPPEFESVGSDPMFTFAYFPHEAGITDPVEVQSVDTTGSSGTVSIDAGNSSVTYTPDSGISVPVGEVIVDRFSYTAVNPNNTSETDIATVYVQLTNPNDAPSVIGTVDPISVQEDAADVTLDLTTLFDDADLASGDQLSYTLQTPSANLVSGSVSGTTMTITFGQDQNGEADVSLVATDSFGETASIDFSVTVAPVQDPVRGTPDEATTTKDVAITVPVLENDVHPDSIGTASLTPYEAANIFATQTNTSNTGASVIVGEGQATQGFQLRSGSNRGDYNIQIGSIADDDAPAGILLSSIAQNSVDHNQGQGVQTGTSQVATSGESYFIPLHDSPGGGEYNSNIAAAYLPFDQGWEAGHFFNTNNGGPTALINSNRDFTLRAPAFSFQEGVDGYTGVTDGSIAPATQDFTTDADFLDGGGSLTQGLFRFDNIIGSATGQIPSGTQIDHARLVITTTTTGFADSGGPYNVHPLLVSFDENSTWDDPFGGEGPDEASGSIGPALFEYRGLDSGSVVQANVTSAVQQWLDGTADNNGFSINAETTNGWSIWFSEAAEAGFRPKLEVYLDSPPAADEVVDHFDGTIDLSLAGIDSQTDGVLLVNGGSNQSTYALSQANADGSWTLFTKDNGADGALYESAPAAYAFVPNGTPDVISGRFEGDGDIQLQSGNFTITPQGTGEYLLEIAGFTPADGSLIVSAEGGGTNNLDNFVTYEPSGDGWLIQSHDIGDDALEDVGDEAVASFAFFPFGDDLTITLEETGSATNGPNVSELGASLSITAEGTIDYDPTASSTLQALNPGESLVDTFTYTIRDGRGTTDVVTVTVNVFGSSVVAANDGGTTRSSETLVIGALANDTDFNSPGPQQAVAAANVEEDGGVFTVVQSTPDDRQVSVAESVTGKVRLDIDNQAVSVFDGLTIASIRENASGDADNFRLVVSAPVGSAQWLEIDQFGFNSASNADLGVAFFPYTDSPVADFTFSQGREIAPGVTYNSVLDGVITGDGSSFFNTPDDGVFLDGNGNEGQALYRFDDIFGNGPGQIPFGTQIHSARFSLVTSTAGNAQSGGPYNLHEILVPWDDTATQTTLPFFDENDPNAIQGLGGEISPEIGSFSAMSQGTIAVSNVTQTVQGWLDGNANNGLGITAGTGDGWRPFLSEASVGQRPQLEIFVDEPQFADPTWTAGTITSDGTLFAGDPRVITTQLQNGNFHIQIPGVTDSREQGLLFAIGNDNNDDNVASATAIGGNAWEIIQRDNTTDTFSAGEDGSMGFVFLPWTTGNLTAGRVDASQKPASTTAPVPLHQAAGEFSLTRDDVGTYRLSIAGATPSDGMLLLSPADYEVGTGGRAFLSYQADGDDFIIQNHEQPTTELIDSDFAFAYVPFVDTVRPGSDNLTIESVDGNSINPGSTVTIGSGAQVTLNTDGSFSYDPNGQFDSLTYGQTAVDTFTYSVTDGVAPSTATVTVTIVGERTELEVANPLPDVTTTQDAVDMVIDISDVFHDPEGNELTVSLDLANSQYLDATLVDDMLTLDFNSRRDGIAFVSLTATDNLGREITDGFKIVVNPETVRRPLVENETAATDEATPILGIDVLGNDTELQTAPSAYGSRIDGNRDVTNAEGAWQLLGTSTAPYNIDVVVDDNNGDVVIGQNVVRDPTDGSITSFEELDLANGYNMGVYRGDVDDPAPVATVEGYSGFGRVGYATSQGAGGGGEINVPVGGAWFPADNGFVSSHFGPNFLAFESGGIESEYLNILNSGHFEVNLPFVNDSEQDGYLFGTGIGNGDNVISVAPQGGTTWEVKQFDNDTDILGGVNGRKQGEDSNFSLMYIPADYPGLIAGRVDSDGNVLQQSGTFNISSDTSGEWELDIPGEVPTSGILIATAVGTDPRDGEPIAATAYYQERFNAGGDSFLLNADFVDDAFTYEASFNSEIQFAFIPFVDDTELAELSVTNAVSAAGAVVNMNADGTLDYDPNGQFDSLGQDETATDTITYTVANGLGSEYTGSVTVTITGIGDVVPFQVSQFTPTPSGFDAQFNASADLSTLNIYDGPDATVDTADLQVTASNGFPVPGSFTWNADSNTLSFVATGDQLPDGDYDVTLVSGTDAFVDTLGQLLDGNADNTAGDDFVTSFTVNNSVSAVLHLPDFARGAGQPVNVPATGSGVPLSLDGATDVTDFEFNLAYDPTLLNISAANLGADLPGDWTVNVDTTTTPGVALITGSGSAFSGSDLEVVSLVAAVPTDAPYGGSQLLDLHNLSLNAGATTVLGDDAIHKAVFLGDTDGDGVLAGNDVTAAAQLSVFLFTGFDAHDWTDPLIVSDVDSDGLPTGVDATWIAQKSVFISRPEIPDVTQVPSTFETGIDPQYQIDADIPGNPGETVSVPVFLDIEPEAADAVNGVTFFVGYDPNLLSVMTSDIMQSDGTNARVDAAHSWTTDNGWTITRNVAPFIPQVGGPGVAITFNRSDVNFSATGLNHLADINFTVATDAPAGSTPLNAEPVSPTLNGLSYTSDDGSILIAGEPSELIISEIMYNPFSAEDDWEYVELYNAGTSAVDLSGYVIDDINGSAHPTANIASGSIPAGGTAVLFNSEDVTLTDFEAAWGIGINLIPVATWGNMGLNNGGDTLSLWSSFASYTGDHDTHANALITVAYDDDGTDWPLDDGNGSIYLTDLTADPNVGTNWALSTDGVNTPAGGAAYTSSTGGGNSGADVGSLGGTLAVVNSAPVITAADNQAIDEGDSLTTFTVATFTDADAGDTHTATIDWGDGSSVEAGTVNQASGTITGSHTYADDGSFTVTVSITDGTDTDTETFTVQVDNVAPTIALTGNATTNEGASYTLNLGAVTDPGDDTATAYTVNWGDGMSDTVTTLGDVTHTYAEGPNDYTIRVDVTDEDSTFSESGSLNVTVNNVAPTVEAGANQSLNTGSSLSLAPATFTDPGTDTHTATIDWGDGTATDTGTVNQAADSVAGTHTYTTAGTYTVTVTVDDGDDTGSDTFTVTVSDAANNAPVITAAADQNLNEGDSLTSFTLASFSDADSTSHTATIDWGDGSSVDTATVDQADDTVSGSHTYADDGTFTVTVTVDDGSGNQATDTFTVSVANVAPSINITGAATVNEGSSYSLNLGAVSDPGDDTVSQFIVDWGDGSSNTFTSAGVQTHTYDNGPNNYTISVDLVDEDGTIADADTQAVTVNNEAPTALITGPTSGAAGDTLSFTFSASDPSTVDAANLTYEVDWDNDGTVDVTQSGTSAGITLSNTFPTPGNFTISLTATDPDGDSGTDTHSVAIVGSAEPVVLVDGDLIVTGTVSSDRIIVSSTGSGLRVRYNNTFYGPFSVSGNVLVFGLAGNDQIITNTNVPAISDGGQGNDYIAGSTLDDTLLGGAGNDIILAGEGDNFVDGGSGSDRLEGRSGVDVIFGGEGNDRINGGAGDDILDGGDGNDFVFGNLGNDLLLGREGADTLNGHFGNDVIHGGGSSDQIFGGNDHDLLLGGLGSDRLRGDSGDDDLIGGTSDLDTDLEAALDALLASLSTDLAGADSNVNNAINAWFNSGTDRSGLGSFDSSDGTDELTGGSGADEFTQADGIRDLRDGETYIQ